ncbi:Abci7 protein [Thalictrum thalictroides]|uniref:Abci7 protein n=1 Tax=Thalictrum thalictroides TaxID=46969 RepID=A0A7J6WUU0_THATH|nr:Abci7 protein [Thalictrum thalictroides]
MAASSTTFSHFLPHSISLYHSKPKLRFKTIQPIRATLSDPLVLQIAETFEDSLSSSITPSLQKLRDTSSQSILSLSWPTVKDEPFRFTDTSFIKTSEIKPVSVPSSSIPTQFNDTQFANLVIVDGHVISSYRISEFPKGVFVGSVNDIDSEVIKKRVFEFVSDFQDGDLFWSLNGIGAPDFTVVYVPSECKVDIPLHFTFFSSESGDIESKVLPVSNPRVLVLVEKGGEIEIIEEYFGGDESQCYWVNSAMEVLIGEGGKVTHSYIQRQGPKSAHTKWTFVRQEAASTYKVVEISTGGTLSRHNLHVQQVGPDTVTELSTFHLCVNDQTQDLHSRLILDHPRGTSQQLHKCIVAHSSGKVVFDGNVKVNSYSFEFHVVILLGKFIEVTGGVWSWG